MQSLFVLLSISSASGVVSDTHPIENVIGLLQGLQEKVKGEAAAEEVTFTKFAHWCATSEKTLDAAITKEKQEIDILEDSIAAKSKQSEQLSNQITALEKDIAGIEASGAAADAQRQTAGSVYQTALKQYSSTIGAIDAAIQYLTGAKDATVGLAQEHVSKVLALVSTSVTDDQHATLFAFTDPARPDLKAEGDYGAHVKQYAFKSRNVIELLKELKTKFEDEKLALTKGETNSINSDALAGGARTNAITSATTSKTTKEEEKGNVDQELVADKADLGETQNDLSADSDTLSQTQKQCALKKSEYAERSRIRNGEVEAIVAAVAILAKVTGVRTEAPSNPIPPASPVDAVAFLQQVDPQTRVVQLLRAEAREVHSRALERLAQEISVHRAGPFNEVNNMIQKMIFRLMDEQKNEDTHKNWCDLEMEKTNTSKVDKEDKHAELSAKIQTDTATVATLTEDISANAEMLASIVSHMTEAIDIRETGKKENAVSVKDSEDAQAALANAIAVLEAFYKESGMVAKETWEFVQRGVELPATPATWADSYTGVTDPKAQPEGIITVLKRLAAEFATMEADTHAQEASDQAEFEEDMKRCDIEKARRTKESQMQEEEKKRLLDKVTSLTKARKQVSSELEATEQYIKDLQPACVEGDSTYEDRKAARSKEITALKESQEILAQAFAENSTAVSAAFLAPVHQIA